MLSYLLLRHPSSSERMLVIACLVSLNEKCFIEMLELELCLNLDVKLDWYF